MTNKINGDFDTETIEAFRSAYASRILSPEDQEVDVRTGLPTDVVLNTSPWIQHTGLWKANDGTDKNFVPNQTLVPGVEAEMSEEELDDLIQEALGELEEGGEGEEELDLEEIDKLLEEIEEEEELEKAIQDLLEEDGFDDNELDPTAEGSEDEIGDEEIEALLEEILNEVEEEEVSPESLEEDGEE